MSLIPVLIKIRKVIVASSTPPTPVVPANALVDSDGTLILDSDGNQLLDSNG